jgi:hypothetical protein
MYSITDICFTDFRAALGLPLPLAFDSALRLRLDQPGMQIIFTMGILEETTRMTKGFVYSNGNAPLLIETSRMPSSTMNACKIWCLFPSSSP